MAQPNPRCQCQAIVNSFWRYEIIDGAVQCFIRTYNDDDELITVYQSSLVAAAAAAAADDDDDGFLLLLL